METNELGMPYLGRNPKSFELLMDFMKNDGKIPVKNPYMRDLLMTELKFFELDKQYDLRSFFVKEEEQKTDYNDSLKLLLQLAECSKSATMDVSERKFKQVPTEERSKQAAEQDKLNGLAALVSEAL